MGAPPAASSPLSPTRLERRWGGLAAYLFAPEDARVRATETFSLVAAFRYDAALPYPSWGPQAGLFRSSTLNHLWSHRLGRMLLIRFHLERLAEAAAALGWPDAAEAVAGDANRDRILDSIVHTVSGSRTRGEEAIEVRLMLARDGTIQYWAHNTPLAPLPAPLLLPLSLFEPSHLPAAAHVWGVAVTCVAVETSDRVMQRTTQASAHGFIRQKFGVEGGARSDVLYFNANAMIVAGTATTPYFWREDPARDHSGKWVTPAAYHGCHCGTTRRYALDSLMCVEGDIHLDSLRQGERVWLSNSIMGWGWGELQFVDWPWKA